MKRKSKSKNAARKVVTPARPVKADTHLETLRSRIAASAAYFHEFKVGSVPFRIPPDTSCSYQTDAKTAIDYIVLANGMIDAPSYEHTGGYSIRLPDAVEAAASGRRVAVNVIARSAAHAISKFALAYSTNEVGNSGWRWQQAGPEWSVFTMEYDVPAMKEGRGDFIGILADTDGRPGIELCYMSVKTLDRVGH